MITITPYSGQSKTYRCLLPLVGDIFPEEEKEEAQATSPNLFLSQLKELNILNQELWLQEEFIKPLPALDRETLIKIAKILDRSIEANFKDKTKVSYSLRELLEFIIRKSPALIKDIEIVGSSVFGILKDHYLRHYLISLGIEQPEKILTSELILSQGSPSDLDIRINLNSETKKELKKLKKTVKEFFAAKLKEQHPKIPDFVLIDHVQKKAFAKLNIHYKAGNYYSTIAINGNVLETSEQQTVELLFVQKLKRKCLFTRDSLRLQIKPLLDGLSNFENSLTDAINSGFFCPSIIPESDLQGGQAFIDRLGGVVRALKPHGIDYAGLPNLLSLYVKGLVSIQEDLEETLLNTLKKANAIFLASEKPSGLGLQPECEANLLKALKEIYLFSNFQPVFESINLLESTALSIFRLAVVKILMTEESDQKILEGARAQFKDELVKIAIFNYAKTPLEAAFLEELKRTFSIYKIKNTKLLNRCLRKTLNNHHSNTDIYAAFAITFHFCQILKNQNQILPLWKTMRGKFPSQIPMVQTVDTLMMEGVPFEEISAYLQAKAFLQWHTQPTKESYETSILDPLESKENLFIRIKLGKSYLSWRLNPVRAFTVLAKSKNAKLKIQLQEFFYQKNLFVIDKNLAIDWNSLLNLCYNLLQKNQNWAIQPFMLSLLQIDSKIAFYVLVDFIPLMLPYPELMKMAGQLAITKKQRQLLANYEAIKEPQNAQLRWLRALSITSEILSKKSFDIWKNFSTSSAFSISFAIDLSYHRTDLSFQVLKSLVREEIAGDIPHTWTAIYQNCRKKNFHEYLPYLVENLKWLFVQENSFVKMPKSVLQTLIGIRDKLIEQKELASAMSLLTFARDDYFEDNCFKDLLEFRLTLYEMILEMKGGAPYAGQIWERLKEEFKFVSATTSRLEKLKLLSAQNICAGKISLNELNAFSCEIENAKRIYENHAEKLLSSKIQLQEIENAYLVVEQIFTSQFDLSKSFAIKKLFDQLCRLLLQSKIEDKFSLLTKLLSNLKFTEFFTVNELITLRSLFLIKAHEENPLKHNLQIRKFLKLNLETIKLHEKCSSLPCANFLLFFVKNRNLENTPLIKDLLDVTIWKMVRDLDKNDQREVATKLIGRISFQDKLNRLTWLEKNLPHLSRNLESPFKQTLILSLCQKLLHNNPNLNEVNTIVRLYQASFISINEWLELVRYLFDDTKYFAIAENLFVDYLEKNRYLQCHPKRNEFWIAAIEGFEKKPQENPWFFFTKISSILEIFDEPCSMVERIFNLLKLVPFQKSLDREEYEIIIAAETAVLAHDKIKNSSLTSPIKLKVIEVLSYSLDALILQKAAQKLIEYLNSSNQSSEIEIAVYRLLENFCRLNLHKKDPIFQTIQSLLELVRNKCDPIKTTPLIGLLNKQNRNVWIKEACRFVLRLKDESHKGRLRINARQTGQHLDHFFQNCLENKFKLSFETLLNCFEQIEWVAPLNLLTIPAHFFTFISKRIQYLNETSDENGLERLDIINQVKNNLGLINVGNKFHSLCIELVLELIAHLETIKIIENLNAFLLKIGCQYYTEASSPKRSPRSKVNSQIKKVQGNAAQPLSFLAFEEPLEALIARGVADSEDDKLSEIEFKIQSWRIFFLTKLLSRDFIKTEDKKWLMENAINQLKLLLKTKNKDYSEFERIFANCWFIPFLKEQHPLFIEHLDNLKELLSSALKNGDIDKQFSCLAMIDPKCKTSSIFLDLFKLRLEKCLAPNSGLFGINQAIFMIQEGKPRLINRHPELLDFAYSSITETILKLNDGKQEPKLLSILKSGITENYARKSKPDLQKGKNKLLAVNQKKLSRELEIKWKNTTRSVVLTTFQAIINCKAKDQEKLKLAFEFMKRLIENETFKENMALYIKLLENLMRLVHKADIPQHYFVKSSLKIAFYIEQISTIQNTKTSHDKFLWIDRIENWMIRLLKLNSFKGLYSAKKIFSLYERRILKEQPKKGEHIKNLLAEAFKRGFEKEKIQKGISDLTLRCDDLLLLLDVHNNTVFSESDLLHADWMVEVLVAERRIPLALEVLKELSLLNSSANSLEHTLWLKWLEKILDHVEGGIDPVAELLENRDFILFKKLPYSISIKFYHKLVNLIYLETVEIGELKRRSLIEALIINLEEEEVFEELKLIAKLDLAQMTCKNQSFLAKRKLKWAYRKCFSANELFILGLRIRFVDSIDNMKYCDAIEFIEALDIVNRINDLDAFLEELFFKTLSILLSEPPVYEERLEFLKCAYEILNSPYFRMMAIKRELDIYPYLFSFLRQAKLLKGNELEFKVQKLLEEFPKINLSFEKGSVVLKELIQIKNLKSISSGRLKEILSLNYVHEPIVTIVSEIFSKNLEGKQIWEGLPEDRSICWLKGLEMLREHESIKTLNFFEDFEIFINIFNNDTYRLSAIRILFLCLENILDNEVSFINSIAFSNLRKVCENYFKTIPDLSSAAAREVDLSTSVIMSRVIDPACLKNALSILTEINFLDALPYQVEKAQGCLVILMRRLQMFDACEELDLQQMMNSICRASKNIRETATCINKVDNIPLLTAFATNQKNKKIVKEACHLACLEIRKMNEPSHHFELINIILNNSINANFDNCRQVIYECLFYLNRSCYSGSEALAILWEKQFKQFKPEENLKCFNLTLASLPGVYNDERISNNHIAIAFDFIIKEFKNTHLFLKMHRALMQALKHYLFLRKFKKVSAENLFFINSTNLTDLSRDPLKLLDNYISFIHPRFDNSASDDQISTLSTLLYLKFLNYFSNQTRINVYQCDEKNEKEFIKDVTKLLLFLDNKLKELLDRKIENPSLYISLLKRYVLFPFNQSEFITSEVEKEIDHLGKSRNQIEKAKCKGLFDNYPKKFYFFQIIFKDLKPTENIIRLTLEEKKEILLKLLKYLAKEGSYSSLVLSIRLVQERKPDILIDCEPDFFVQCNKIVISGLQDYYIKSHQGFSLLEHFANSSLKVHFLTNQTRIKLHNSKEASRLIDLRETHQLPKKFIDEQSSNPLIKSNKNAEWQKASAEIQSEIFCTLCKQEINMKISLKSIASKNNEKIDKEFALLDLNKAIQHLYTAYKMHQFDGQYEYFLNCISFLMTISTRFPELQDIKALGIEIFRLITLNILGKSELKEKRKNLVEEWISNLGKSKTTYLFLIEAIVFFKKEDIQLVEEFPFLYDKLAELKKE